MNRDQATEFVYDLLRNMIERDGADLFISAAVPPSIKIDGQVNRLTDQPLTANHTQILIRSLMNDRQLAEFEQNKEINFAISVPGLSRFRVNAFVQKGAWGAVLRAIKHDIPSLADINMPPVMKEIVMSSRGLVILVGGTGSGKSTTLAAMMGYRNLNSHGHIITIEDPIEFVHEHRGCIVTQREIGVDTESYEIALKNALRQSPDVIMIGEIRDRETMEHAITFSEAGHLCLATLHANSANQAIDRIINFFPEERRQQLFMDLSMNLRALISQRLVRRADRMGRAPAVEILINSPLMADLILKGDISAMKELVARSTEQGMQTFDQALFKLFEAGTIDYYEALRNADSVNDLRLKIKLESKRSGNQDLLAGTEKLEMESGDSGSLI
ncbi:MAG TPA: PilT/PilU family type 4a pilus ATPase [Gammaproteobacteria bacterium]|nr:PilT/PilU family type 4a pilus ATPase [Gammaproteobacteria bacterium]